MTARTRPRAPQSARSRELARIHLQAQQLGMIQRGDDETYRCMLWSVARVRSAKDLDEHGRRAVLEHLAECARQRGKSLPTTRKPGATRYERGTQAALIRWLWTQLADAGLVDDTSDRALRRYIGQHAGVTRLPVDEIAPQHLTVRQANQVIEQLKRWLERPAGAVA